MYVWLLLQAGWWNLLVAIKFPWDISVIVQYQTSHCCDVLFQLQQSKTLQHSLHFRCSWQLCRPLVPVSQHYSDFARILMTSISSCSHTIHCYLLEFSHAKVYDLFLPRFTSWFFHTGSLRRISSNCDHKASRSTPYLVLLWSSS